MTSDRTGPPFWARPVWSSAETDRPSSEAAVATIWDKVTTPVPPMPTIRRPNVGGATQAGGGGSAADVGGDDVGGDDVGDDVAAPPPRPARPAALAGTLTNDGQSPSRQEASRLQLDWWTLIFGPRLVSTGWR